MLSPVDALVGLLRYAGHTRDKALGAWCGPVTCQCGYVEARDAAVAAVKALVVDRDDWQTLHAAWRKRAEEAERDIESLRATLDEIGQAFEKYGDHRPECKVSALRKCSCGFTETSKRLREASRDR